MKNLVLILMLTFPLVVSAQFDDIYFVPKKEKKVVAEVVDENVFAYDEYSVEDAAPSEEQYEYYDEEDFPYSTRIVRFRSPARLIGSSLYWDLRYNCGIDDWLVYDNGYTLDIYPTYNNPYYYWSYAPYNNWWYCSYNHWNDYYWGCHHYYPSYHWYGHHHCHYGGFHPGYIAHNSWRPQHKVQVDVPVNKSLNKGERKTVANNSRRENSLGVPVNRGRSTLSGRPGAQAGNASVRTGQTNRPVSGNGVRTATVRPQSVGRGSANSAVRQNRPGSQGENLQQKNRQTNSTVRSTSNRQQHGSSTNVRTNKRHQSSSQSGNNESRSSYRNSDNSSSREYNRPSSTSVTRQRSYSSGSRPTSGFSGGGGAARGTSGVRSGSRR